jgi:hypothetical protein
MPKLGCPQMALSPAPASSIEYVCNAGATRLQKTPRNEAVDFALERDDFSSNRHPALSFCLSMIFSENRQPLFRIML